MADGLFRIDKGATFNPQSSIPTNPVNGDVYYDNNQNTFVLYDNGVWTNWASRTDVVSATNLTSSNFTATVVQNPFVRVTGSTAANICGLSAGTGGQRLIVYNQSSATAVIVNQSGTEPTAANRIITMTGGNVTLGSGIMAQFVYDDSQARWIADTFATGETISGIGTGGEVDINPAVQSPYALSSGNSGQIFLVNSANGAMIFDLPAPASGLIFTFKDAAGSMAINNLTLHRFASESIDNVAADYVLNIPYGSFTVTGDGTNWYIITGNRPQQIGIAGSAFTSISPNTQSPYSITRTNDGTIFLVNSTLGAMIFDLPSPATATNMVFTVKDSGGNFSINNCTIHRFGSESIELLAADYVMQASYGKWTFACDGTNWWIVTG